MSKIFLVLLSVCCLSAIARELPKHNMTQKVLLDKIEKAVDPKGVAKKWKTLILKMQMDVPMQQNKAVMTAMCKFPDKSKSFVTMTGMPTTTMVYDGKRAWKETSGLGVEEKTGVQLAFAKFESKRNNPVLELSDIYEKITLDPYLHKVGKFTCYKLICTLPAELKTDPSQMFVDNKKFLIRRAVSKQLTGMGAIPVSLDFSDYKFIKGINIAMSTKTSIMGMTILAKTLSLEINKKIPDSEFKFPGK